MQRLTVKYNIDKEYQAVLCKKIYDNKISLWNWDWTNINKDNQLESYIFNKNILKQIEPIIDITEVDAFTDYEV